MFVMNKKMLCMGKQSGPEIHLEQILEENVKTSNAFEAETQLYVFDNTHTLYCYPVFMLMKNI